MSYRDKYIKMYRKQLNKLYSEVSNALLDENFYYSNGNFNKQRKLALIEQIEELLVDIDNTGKEFLAGLEEQYKLNVEKEVLRYEKITGLSANLRKDWTLLDKNDLELLVKDFTISMKEHKKLYSRQLRMKLDVWDNQNRIFLKNASNETLKNIIVGGESKKVAIRRMVENLSDQGIRQYTYTKMEGKKVVVRNINLQSYAELRINSAIGYLTNKGSMNTTKRLGGKYIKFSSHMTHCELCATYVETNGEGRVYSLQENDKKYPWIGVIPNFLLYNIPHPNCRHRVSSYFPEYADDNEATKRNSNLPFEDRRSKAQIERYDNAQQYNNVKRRNRDTYQELKGLRLLKKDLNEKDKRRLEQLEETNRRQKNNMKKVKEDYKKLAKGSEL